MSREYRLQKLLKNPHIWRRGEFSVPGRKHLPSGFNLLDQRLGGGWPVGVLTELLLDRAGIGELRLLMPALERLTRDEPAPDRDQHLTGCHATTDNTKDWLVWISPPYIPYVPALTHYGLDVSRMLVVRSGQQLDGLWAMEQALQSSACAVVVAWLADVDDRSMRRLQLAAESGACWAIVFRHARFATGRSPAPLRIHLEPGGEHASKRRNDYLHLHIVRNRYGPVGALSLQC